MWDFDPAETVGEKMSKILDVKGVKGLSKWMKEIAVTASTGKHDNELIGRCNISLKVTDGNYLLLICSQFDFFPQTIPTTGLVMWFSLDKKNKLKHQGLIRLRLSFSADKIDKVSINEHKHLLRILLLHELDSSKVAPYWWSGKFSVQGEAVIAQHATQSGLTVTNCALAQWAAFTIVHANHHLAFKLFETLLEKLHPYVRSVNISHDELKTFWEGARKLLPSCFSTIRNIRKRTAGDKASLKILGEVLSIISMIGTLNPIDDFDLFPQNVYG